MNKFFKIFERKKYRCFGDFELVVNQMNDSYQTKNLCMRAYRKEVWDMLGNFFIEHRIMAIPRMKNQVSDSRATIARNFNLPSTLRKKQNRNCKYTFHS